MEVRELALGMTDYRLEAREAFDRILLAHERLVLRTALRLLGRLEDAEDASQEVFLRLHRALRRLDEERDLKPWLYRVTVNVCRDIAYLPGQFHRNERFVVRLCGVDLKH